MPEVHTGSLAGVGIGGGMRARCIVPSRPKLMHRERTETTPPAAPAASADVAPYSLVSAEDSLLPFSGMPAARRRSSVA